MGGQRSGFGWGKRAGGGEGRYVRYFAQGRANLVADTLVFIGISTLLVRETEIGYNKGMNVTINQSALQHEGITEEDILRALELPLVDRLMPKFQNKYLLIGFDRNSNLLEIMYNIRTDGSYNVFHAMKCRKEYYYLVEESSEYV
jgi:hypothetical protein